MLCVSGGAVKRKSRVSKHNRDMPSLVAGTL